jgi:exopolysaccharide biosynthesis polyprenyl glycosylphosphotransferase
MAEVDNFVSTGAGRPRSREDEIVQRTLLCAVVAGLEGLAAFAIVFCAALLYHLLVLHQSVLEFNAVFYAAYGLLTGGVYATFAAIACGQFLDRHLENQLGLHQAFYAWTAALAITLLTAFLLGKVADFSRVSLTSAYLGGVPTMLGVRTTLRAFLDGRIRRGELHFETIAVAGNRVDVLNFLLGGELWRQGHKLTGTLYFEDARDQSGALQPSAISDFAAASLKRGTDHIVFVGAVADLDELDGIVGQLKRYSLNLLYAPASRNRSLKFLDVVAIGPNNVLRFVRTPMSDEAVLLKRSFDVALSAFGLVVLAPLFALVALAIVVESRSGPVIYKQARRGFNGDTFMIWKFRTMTVTESGYEMRQAERHDPRITRVGRILRATSIDELPQLVNVLTGQMSLVGPRPHAISHDEELGRHLAVYAHRQRIKPGITGWAQVHGFRGETNNREQIEGRVEHDIYYIDHWSIFLDIWILILTVFSPATRRNAR